MISTEQAINDKVSGWDVYLSDHIIYVGDINRIRASARICLHAYMLISDATIFKYRRERHDEANAWKLWISDGGTFGEGAPETVYVDHQTDQYYLDCFKIGSAIELGLKARLLIKSYLIHLIKNKDLTLYREQKNRPISVNEFISVSNFCHNGTYNFLPDLTDNTLGYSQILDKDEYKNILDLTNEEILFVNESRKRRNMIHLPIITVEPMKTPLISSLYEADAYLDYLCNILNKLIVDVFNVHRGSQDALPRF